MKSLNFKFINKTCISNNDSAIWNVFTHTKQSIVFNWSHFLKKIKTMLPEYDVPWFKITYLSVIYDIPWFIEHI